MGGESGEPGRNRTLVCDVNYHLDGARLLATRVHNSTACEHFWRSPHSPAVLRNLPNFWRHFGDRDGLVQVRSGPGRAINRCMKSESTARASRIPSLSITVKLRQSTML